MSDLYKNEYEYNSNGSGTDISKLHIVTVATESKYYFPYLQESCRRNGKELEVLGMGEKWEGFNWKFKKMIEYLKSLPEDDIVCFVDGYDIICTRNLHELITVFLEIKEKEGCTMVVGFDNVNDNKLAKFVSYFVFDTCKNRGLNSGTYIGFVKDILKIIEKVYNLNPKNDADDQMLLTQYCKNNENDIYIDVNNELFLIFCKTGELDKYVTIQDYGITYKDKRPFFIHAAGGMSYLDDIIIKLNYNYRDNIKKKLQQDFYLKRLPNIMFHFGKNILSRPIVFIIILFFIFYSIYNYNKKKKYLMIFFTKLPYITLNLLKKNFILLFLLFFVIGTLYVIKNK